jgi:hypothetical protein
MSVRLEERAERARCYSCGSPVVLSVCHHCARPMCAEHSPRAADVAGRPLSHEFGGLRLDSAAPYHCDGCRHVVRGRLWALTFAGGLALAVGVAVVIVGSVVLGLAILLGGLVTAVLSHWTDQRRKMAAISERTVLPLVPNVDAVSVRESLIGSLRLDAEGTYEAPVALVDGIIRLSLSLGKADRDRLKSYQRKYRLGDQEDIEFSAGFAVLDGEAGLELAPHPSGLAAAAPGGTVIPLRGKVGAYPSFVSSDRRTARPWKLDFRYSLQEARRSEVIPIWLTPTLVPEADQRSLALDLQWTEFGSDDKPLMLDRIEHLTLKVPVYWGNVENVRGRALIGMEDVPGQADEVLRTISWAQIAPSRADRDRQRLTLTVRFEKKIELQKFLRGDVEVTFKGAMSGLTAVDIYHPLGERRRGLPGDDVKTHVSADFELSLRRIRYQDTRVVPDRKHDTGIQETDEFPGVIPDHETVIALTNAMSDLDYYVKRVIENPPRSGKRANVVNRYWDIAGRRYNGVYPVDFHIILTGEEVHKRNIHAWAGNTRIRMTVQAAYATPEMEQQIVEEWRRLHDLVLRTLSTRATSRQSGPWGVFSPPGEVPGNPHNGSRTQREQALRKQLEEVAVAVVKGLISNETYWDIKSRIEQELEDE